MGRNNYILLICLIALIASIPFIIGTDSYWISVLVMAGIYSIVTIGLSLLIGYAGQISLGHGAFFGLGAYTSGLLTTMLPINPWIAMVIAMIFTALVALVIGIPTLRLSGHYLAMATLAIGEIIAIIATAEVDLTGGPSGFGEIPLLSIFGFELDPFWGLRYYIFVWTVVVLVMIISLNLIHSRVGRALRSIHDSELAANAMGVNTTFYKIQIFVVSAALASLAGSLYAHNVTFVSPTTCEIKFSVLLVVMVAVGGMKSVWGGLLGAVLLTLLPEYLTIFEDYDILIYGLILMGIMIFLEDGLVGTFIRVKNFIAATLFSNRTRKKRISAN